LKYPIPFGLLRVFLAIRFPIIGIGLDPLFLAAFLVSGVDRIRFYLMPLPGGFLGPMTFYFLTGGLIFVSWAFIKKITAINTKKLFHIVAPHAMNKNNYMDF
jgi:hypothetical protein